MLIQKCLSFLILAHTIGTSHGLSTEQSSRRTALKWLATSATAAVFIPAEVLADGAEGLSENFDVENFLKSGMVSMPMGVSGQAGKSRPETGVILRDGSEVSRDPRSGDVLAEILLRPASGSEEKIPVLASYASPWPLATGTVFDVECRDPKNGDGAFLAVGSDTGGSSIAALKDSFFINDLIKPTGRFSFYGSPTDVKVKSSSVRDAFRIIDFSFSTLSQSTQTEIPRRARMIATIPPGTKQAVMLVGSAGTLRWKKGSEEQIAKVVDSFRAIPAPQTSMKVRAKKRRSNEL